RPQRRRSARVGGRELAGERRDRRPGEPGVSDRGHPVSRRDLDPDRAAGRSNRSAAGRGQSGPGRARPADRSSPSRFAARPPTVGRRGAGRRQSIDDDDASTGASTGADDDYDYDPDWTTPMMQRILNRRIIALMLCALPPLAGCNGTKAETKEPEAAP